MYKYPLCRFPAFRRTTLQCSHLFFTELCTFIPLVCCSAPPTAGLAIQPIQAEIGLAVARLPLTTLAVAGAERRSPAVRESVRSREAILSDRARCAGLFCSPETERARKETKKPQKLPCFPKSSNSWFFLSFFKYRRKSKEQERDHSYIKYTARWLRRDKKTCLHLRAPTDKQGSNR